MSIATLAVVAGQFLADGALAEEGDTCVILLFRKRTRTEKR